MAFWDIWCLYRRLQFRRCRLYFYLIGPCHRVFLYNFIFLTYWIRFNRPEFESDTKKTLASEDIVTLESYYKRSPASGFWLLEYGEKFIGLIAVDAPKPRISKKSSDAVPTYATIRHFYVQEPYRGISMQTDLLLFAIDQVFKNDHNIQSIRASSSALSDYIGTALINAGFRVLEQAGKIGVFRWKITVYELTRAQWETKRSG